MWRRIGIQAETNILNYTTKRGYRVALRQDNHKMGVDVELEEAGFTSKTRAKFFNRIWHPYLPQKVSAMQWLVLTEGLLVGAWRERIGLPSTCPLCPAQAHETLQHAFQDCTEVQRAWQLFRNTRMTTGAPPSYHTWNDISRGLMTDPPGPSIDEELQWDTAAAFTLNSDTPWDILRAQLLWSIWCQRVTHTFSDDQFHLGVVLWNAWRNTIYCAMEAYKELFRHKRNEEKRQQIITCFQQIWTASNTFGRLRGTQIKWNLTPPQEFLPKELAAWTATPIRIHRLSPSPDAEEEFAARADFANQVDDFLQEVAQQWRPAAPGDQEPEVRPSNPASPSIAPDEAATSLQDNLQNPSTPTGRRSPTRAAPPTVQVPCRETADYGPPQGSEPQGTISEPPGPERVETPLEQTYTGAPSDPNGTHNSRRQVASRAKKRCTRRMQHPSQQRKCNTQRQHQQLIPQLTSPNTQIRRPPTSRPKRRCSRRLRHPHKTHRIPSTEQAAEGSPLNNRVFPPPVLSPSTYPAIGLQGKKPDLPKATPGNRVTQSSINTADTRTGPDPTPAPEAPPKGRHKNHPFNKEVNTNPPSIDRSKPSSRPKTKCRFGPQARRGRPRHRSDSPPTREAPPPPPSDRTATRRDSDLHDYTPHHEPLDAEGTAQHLARGGTQESDRPVSVQTPAPRSACDASTPVEPPASVPWGTMRFDQASTEAEDSQEFDELLQEIDRTRRHALHE